MAASFRTFIRSLVPDALVARYHTLRNAPEQRAIAAAQAAFASASSTPAWLSMEEMHVLIL